MVRRSLLNCLSEAICPLVLLALVIDPARAIVLDDFVIGRANLPGDFDGLFEISDQTNLDPAQVPFTRRLYSYLDVRPTGQQGTTIGAIETSAGGSLHFGSTGSASALPWRLLYGEDFVVQGKIPDVDLLSHNAVAFQLNFLDADFGPVLVGAVMGVQVQIGLVRHGVVVFIPESTTPFSVTVPFEDFVTNPDFSAVNTLTFFFNSTPLGTSFTLDSITTVDIPEPSSAMLCLVSLAAVIKRSIHGAHGRGR